MKVFRSIKKLSETITKWIAIISAIITAVGYVFKFFEWGKSGPFKYILNNIQIAWLISLSFTAVTLWIWISRLHKRFVSGFRDKFTVDLRSNWDFQ